MDHILRVAFGIDVHELIKAHMPYAMIKFWGFKCMTTIHRVRFGYGHLTLVSSNRLRGLPK